MKYSSRVNEILNSQNVEKDENNDVKVKLSGSQLDGYIKENEELKAKIAELEAKNPENIKLSKDGLDVANEAEKEIVDEDKVEIKLSDEAKEKIASLEEDLNKLKENVKVKLSNLHALAFEVKDREIKDGITNIVNDMNDSLEGDK